MSNCRKKFRKKLTCISDMNKRVVMIGKVTNTNGEGGGTTINEGALGTVWAFLRPMSGNEVLNAQVRQQQVTHTMTTRYNAALLATKQVEYDDNGTNRLFRVESVFDPNEDRQELKYKLEENGDVIFDD